MSEFISDELEEKLQALPMDQMIKVITGSVAEMQNYPQMSIEEAIEKGIGNAES